MIPGRMPPLPRPPKHAMLALRPRDTPQQGDTCVSTNRPPEDALWLQDIEEQLDSLVRTAEQRWQRIAALLIEVEAQALWQSAATS